MNYTRALISILLIAILSISVFSQEELNESCKPKSLKEVLAPNEEIQSYLHTFINKEKQGGYTPETEKEWNDKLSKLKKMVSGDNEKLMKELLYFSIKSKGTREGMLPAVIIEMISVSNIELLKGILPYINVHNTKIQREAQDILKAVEDTGKSDNEISFSTYESFIRNRKNKPPLDLIKYMYNRDPSKSFQVMKKVYGENLTEKRKKELREMERKIRNMIKKKEDLILKKKKHSSEEPSKANKLDKQIESNQKRIRKKLVQMASSEFWWSRLYVAEMMRQHSGLRDKDVIKKLQNDSHELIREVISSIQEKKDGKKEIGD